VTAQGTLDGYPVDEETIRISEPFIANFMTDFVQRSGATSVHIIAHSMGNRGVLAAVERIAEQAERRTAKHFGQIILAAADVDADLFRQRCHAYRSVAQQTTLYISARDLAVEASRWLHKFPRVGLMPPVFVAPGIDTISVANADLTMLGHGYVASARDVLKDMHDLIVHSSPPSRRFALKASRTELGEPFWMIRD
jgi:esterase/lipase superfamily enzyme